MCPHKPAPDLCRLRFGIEPAEDIIASLSEALK